MKEIEMIKAFAELDGAEVSEVRGKLWIKDEHGLFSLNGYGHKEYNPITDLALNCAARDKYGVTVDYECRIAFIDNVDCSFAFSSKEYVCKAVIDCILKSKGLWKC